MERVVLCMKWGTLYGPDYVNVLFNACRANIEGKFRFVCLTDDASGIAPEVECYPIPEFGLEQRHWYDGAWPKLGVFSADLYGLTGRALFIDLDMIICGDLTPFFTFGEGLVAIDEGAWNDGVPSTMSSIFAFDLGAHSKVLDEFVARRDEMVAKYKIEQAYLHSEAQPIIYWPNSWLASFKRHLRQPLLFDLLRAPKEPPTEARIIVFHGRPRPIDLIRLGPGNRDLFPHYVKGPVKWARDYWLRFGGRP